MTAPNGDAALDGSSRFLLDHMLGKLAVYLRMCGYDAAYVGDRELTSNAAVREVVEDENRILLTRNRALASRTERAFEITSHDVTDQLAELRAAGVPLELSDPPRRCGRCNGRLLGETPSTERPDYAPSDPETDCWYCERCGQYFWKGSHWDAVADRV